MKGQGIEFAKLYLRKVCEIPAEPFSTNEWKSILTYNTLRNALAHNNGIFDKSNLILNLQDSHLQSPPVNRTAYYTQSN